MQAELTTHIEGAERAIGEIFDEARELLISNNLLLSSTLEDGLHILSTVFDKGIRHHGSLLCLVR